jgi:hypothetical protein
MKDAVADAHAAIPGAFWDNMEAVVGRPIFKNRAKPSYFSCSC